MVTMNATTRREQDKIAYNAMLAACPTRQLLDVLSDKWVCLVLTALTPGPRRHSELSRQIAGVSQKMLTQTLRGLERDGLVTRTVTPAVPVRVDYALTEVGGTLIAPLAALDSWAREHVPSIVESRSRYDVHKADAS